MQDKPKTSKTFAILTGLLLGLLAAGIVFLGILIATPSDTFEHEMTATSLYGINETVIALSLQTVTAAAQRTPSNGSNATLAPCAWSWASQDEPELTSEFQEHLVDLNTLDAVQAFTVSVFTQGENCNRPNTPPSYAVMNTVIRLNVQLDSAVSIADLDTAYAALHDPTLTILETLASYPLDELPGTQVRLEVEFTSDQTTYSIAVYDRQFRAALESPASSSQEFFEQLGGLAVR